MTKKKTEESGAVEEKKEVSFQFGMARAIAVANGHPAPDEYAAKVEAEFDNPTPEQAVADDTATDVAGTDTLSQE